MGRRDLTAAELTAKLTDQGYAPSDVTDVVQRLIDEHAVDDRRTAAAYAETAARIKGRGRLRIRRELEARGISRSVIEDVLRQAAPADDELAAIRQYLTRKRLTERSSPAERRRVFQQLLRRGFPPETIRKVLRDEPDADD
ncbi:MAG: regulatory protein RecX [Acidobacteria bacterium]|nr:regulatory protein RecX [Acidobacteriota bacterium]